jgi:hypothetical protein
MDAKSSEKKETAKRNFGKMAGQDIVHLLERSVPFGNTLRDRRLGCGRRLAPY